MMRAMGKGVAGAVFALIVAFAAVAIAAPSLGPPPGGWRNAASGEARERAEGWASGSGGRLHQAFEPRGSDDFAETLAVIEIAGAFDLDVAASDHLDEVTASMLGTEVTVAFAERSDGETPIDTGEFESGGVEYRVAVASAGPSRAVMVLAMRPDEVSLYDPVFEVALAELEGIAPPLERFALGFFRLLATIIWLVVGAVAWLLITWREWTDTLAQTARLVAAIVAGAAALAGLAVYVALSGSEASLTLEGTSREWVAFEAALVGFSLSIVALVAGYVLGRGERPVRSAPEGGSFERRDSMAAASKLSPNADHPDGESWLQDAEEGSHHDIGPPGPIDYSPQGAAVPDGRDSGELKASGRTDLDPLE